MTASLHPAADWVNRSCGSRHWGRNGAAGLLLLNNTGSWPAGVCHLLLQQRVGWSDQGGTWGLPGGVIGDGESASDAALREASEEVGVDPSQVTVVDSFVEDHGSWRYTTIVGWTTERPLLKVGGETQDATWAQVSAVGLDSYELHPGFPGCLAGWSAGVGRAARRRHLVVPQGAADDRGERKVRRDGIRQALATRQRPTPHVESLTPTLRRASRTDAALPPR